MRTPSTINKAECQKALNEPPANRKAGMLVLQGQDKSHDYQHPVPMHPSIFSSFIILAAYSKAFQLYWIN